MLQISIDPAVQAIEELINEIRELETVPGGEYLRTRAVQTLSAIVEILRALCLAPDDAPGQFVEMNIGE